MNAGSFPALPERTRFSILHNALLELWLRSQILREPQSLAHAIAIALHLQDQPRMGLDLFPTEMERGFILVALGLLYDLAKGDIPTSQEADLRAIIHFHGTELRQNARISFWGLSGGRGRFGITP